MESKEKKEYRKMIQELGIDFPKQINLSCKKKDWGERLVFIAYQRGVSPVDIVYSVLDQYMDSELDIQEQLVETEEALRKKQKAKGGDNKKN